MSAAPPPALPSFRRWLDERCAAEAPRPFLQFRDRSWTYAELARITDAVAARLHERGVDPGDRVALRLPNSPEHLFAWLGAAKLGAAVAPLHAQWTDPEVARALAQLRPKLVLADAAEVASWASTAPLACPALPEPPADAPAELLFTSGTTGPPKVAVQSYRALRLTGEAFADWLRIGPDDRLFTCLPLAHVNARFYSTLGALAAGATLVLEERFSASAFWRWMAESRASVVNTIGAMLRILLMAPPSQLDRAHSLRLVYTSPALGRDLHRAFEERFGVRLVVGYGLTECTFGFIHPVPSPSESPLAAPLDAPDRHLDSMGRPRRHPDRRWPAGWRLVDPATGVEGNAGEIRLTGPTVFLGYLDDPAATAAAFDSEGWLCTGDLAIRDAAGWWTFVGRTKEMIRRRGENLSPLEVEEVLLSHPDVAEAAVLGVPGELGEEEVAAFVVLKRECATACLPVVESLATWCAAHLAPFKVPSEWRLLDALPRTSTNRVAKAELLAQHQKDAR